MNAGEENIVEIEANKKEEMEDVLYIEVEKRSKSDDLTIVFPKPSDHYEFMRTIEGNKFSSWTWTDVLSCLRLSQDQNDFKHFPKSLPWFNPEVKEMKRLFENCKIKKTRTFTNNPCIYYFVLYIEKQEGSEKVLINIFNYFLSLL